MAKELNLIALHQIERRKGRKPEEIEPGKPFVAQSQEEYDELLNLKAARVPSEDEAKAAKPARKAPAKKAAPKPEDTKTEDSGSTDTKSEDTGAADAKSEDGSASDDDDMLN